MPQPHDELVDRLVRLPNEELGNLFHCDLPNMGQAVAPEEYIDWMQTSPYRIDWSRYAEDGTLTIGTEYWDVLWAHGFDEHRVANELRLDWLLGGSLTPLVYIKKEFPRREGSLEAESSGVLEGMTSFGYTANLPHIGPTRNTIRRELLAGTIDEPALPILMMTYSQDPWHVSPERRDVVGRLFRNQGFLDYFRFLTPDIVIAKGNYGPYDPDDPVLDPENLWSPAVLRFFMERVSEERVIDLARETTYLSIPILDEMWERAKAARTSELAGFWEGDLVMNSVLRRSEAHLFLSQSWSTFATSIAGGARIDTVATVQPLEDGRTVRVALWDGPPLDLRRAAEGARVLVGRRCIDVRDVQEVAHLGPFASFLPRPQRTTYAAQYVRETNNSLEYCLHYLLRGF